MAKTKKRKTTLVKIKKPDILFSEIKSQIEQARKHVAVQVNQSLTQLYWNIGNIIHHHLLDSNCADYGKEIVATIDNRVWEWL